MAAIQFSTVLTPTLSVPKPASSSIRSLFKPRWLVFHVLCLASIAVAWLVDESVFHAMNRWYNGPPPVRGELAQLIVSLAMYGQALGFVVTIALILLLDERHRGRALFVGVMIASAGFATSAFKSLVGRERPLDTQGKTVLHGPHKGLTQSRTQSFPSGHTATAFAMSYGVSACYPALAPLSWSLAAGVAVNRLITVRHFLSDVIAGAWLGLVTSAIMARLSSLRRLTEATSQLLAPTGLTMVGRPKETMLRRMKPILASPLLLFATSLLLNWVGNGSTPLWDRDEPRFATAAREMIERDDWIVPTFNGELRPDKPIMIYWLTGLAYRVLGEGTFAARFWSGVGGTAAVAATYFLARRMFDTRVALLAGWILALSPMLIIESKLATVDALLLAETATAVALLWRLTRGPDLAAAIAFWVTLGLAVLTKGPVAVGIVASTGAAYALLSREWAWLKNLRPLMGLVVFALVVAPWVIAVNRATGGDFLRLSLGHHVIKRSTTPLEGHSGFPGYYLLSLVALMAPWAWMLPWAVRVHWPRKRDERLLFLAAWAGATLLIFEFVSTKLVHYYLPAYPALAILVASALVGRFGSQPLGARVFDRRFGRILIAAALVATPVGLAAVGFALPTPAQLPGALVAVVAGGGLLAAGLLIQQHRLKRAFGVLAASLVSAFLVAGEALAPAIGRDRLIVQVAERLKEYGHDSPIALWLYRDPSLVYNVGRVIPVVDSMTETPLFPETLELAQHTGGFVCPMTTKQMAQMAEDPTLSLTIRETVSTASLFAGRTKEVHLVEVRPSPLAAPIERTRVVLRELLPGQARVVMPLFDESPTKVGNAGRRYPLNPVFLSMKQRETK